MAKVTFLNSPTTVQILVDDVKNGRTGLPELQRPFVWKDSEVQKLLDSMYKGYPIGYVMLWESPDDFDSKKHSIGDNNKTFSDIKNLVIDGQQRLTALLAVIHGIKVKDKNYKERQIRIAFNPITDEEDRFAVWTAFIEKDPEWISNITDVFRAKEENTAGRFRRKYIRNLNDSRVKQGKPVLTDEEEEKIENRIEELLDLVKFQLPSVTINNKTDEQNVADIFVRVNSGGQKLNENNFIQTLLAVYGPELSKKIDKFAYDSHIPSKESTSYNRLITLEANHLVRMAVGVGLGRARLRYAYMMLRGKDLETGKVTPETREENFRKFKDALDKVTNLQDWHYFLNILAEAGYISDRLIAAKNALVFSYILYLKAKHEFGVKNEDLRRCIKRWFFMAALTSFYSGSTETNVDSQFADLRELSSSSEFLDYIDRQIAIRLTDDYFRITLPNQLGTSGNTSPEWNAFIASQIVLGSKILFSDTPLANFFLAGTSGPKSSIDRHHIFPRNFLQKTTSHKKRTIDQWANYTYLEYDKNINISDDAPSTYVPKYRIKVGDEVFVQQCHDHALPDGFENMDYLDFLEKRRVLMAEIIRSAYEQVSR